MVMVWWITRPLDEALGHAPRRTVWALLVALAAAFLFNGRPGEVILGGWDPGVYLHTAAAVDRGGALKIVDPGVANLTESEKQTIARDLFGVVEPFGGMRVLPYGTTSPSFHHLYPCLMASVWPLGGLRAALWVNPVLFLVSLVLVFGLAALWGGRGAGWLAFTVMALSPAMVWQAGFPTAEMSTQVFLLGAAVALVCSQRVTAARWSCGLLAGLLLGSGLLVRYDTVLFLVPVVGILLACAQAMRAPAAVAAVLLGLAVPLYHYDYFQRYVAPYYHPVSDLVLQVLAVGGVVLALWMVVRWGLRRREGWVTAADRWLRVLLASLLALWMVLAAVVRPWWSSTRPSGDFLVDWLGEVAGAKAYQILVRYDAWNVYHLADFVGWPALVVAAVTLVVVVYRPLAAETRALLYAALVSLVIIVTHVFNDHFLMWVARRFVPVIVPLLAVVSAVGITRVIATRRSGSRRAVATLLAGLVIGLPLARDSWYIARHRHWPGLIDWVEQVHADIPAGATVFCDQPGFAAPLRYLHGVEAFELMAEDAEGYARLGTIMRERMERGEAVWFLSMRGPFDHEGVTFEPGPGHPLVSTILHQQNRGIPQASRPRGGDFVLYRVEPL
jgi:hypothetical protein